MAFYKDFTQKKKTRADYLRSDGKWEEEGSRYRKSASQQDKQRRENPRQEGRIERLARASVRTLREDGMQGFLTKACAKIWGKLNRKDGVS